MVRAGRRGEVVELVDLRVGQFDAVTLASSHASGDGPWGHGRLVPHPLPCLRHAGLQGGDGALSSPGEVSPVVRVGGGYRHQTELDEQVELIEVNVRDNKLAVPDGVYLRDR